MSMTIPVWFIPASMTAAMLLMMLRPYRMSGDYDFGGFFRILWVIPILGTWVIYLAIMLWIGGGQ